VPVNVFFRWVFFLVRPVFRPVRERESAKEEAKRGKHGSKDPPLRAALACGEIFQRAKPCVEFGGCKAALTVERAQKIRGGAVALARVAFDAAGNQVAIGIAPEAGAWHDVVEALHVRGGAAKAEEASAAFAIVNGFAERPGFQEIRGFEGRGRKLSRGPRGAHSHWRTIFAQTDGVDILGQAHFDEMAGLAAFEQAQSAELIEPAHGLAHRSIGKTQFGGYRHYRKLQAELADHERMAQQMGIDSAIENRQAETRDENILKLHPEESGVQYFGFHVQILEERKEMCEAREKHGSKDPPLRRSLPLHLPCSGRSLDRYEERGTVKEESQKRGPEDPPLHGGARRTATAERKTKTKGAIGA
jgi:hypothetical protein